MKWVNLFGSNVDLSKYGKYAEEQNVDIEKATTFKGRVLIEYFVYDVKHPEMKVMDIPKKDPCKEREKAMEEKEYSMLAEIGSAICLPDENKDYQIKIMLGEKHWLTGEPKEGTKTKIGDYRGYNRWSKRIEETFKSSH